MSKHSKITKSQYFHGSKYTRNAKSLNNSPPKSAQKIKFERLDEYSNTDGNDSFLMNKLNQQIIAENEKNNILNLYRIKTLKFSLSSINISDIKTFKIIGIFDKKIMIGFSSLLNIFCYFDQHAMHQRIRYQYYKQMLQLQNNIIQFSRQWKSKYIQKDMKQIPIISKIKHSYIKFKITKELDNEIQDDLQIKRYGFEANYKKKDRILCIEKVPDILERVLETKLVLEAIQEIMKGEEKIPRCLDNAIAEISCKSAYKFNDVLKHDQITNLIQNLSLCKFPFFCVHGRPTLFTKI